MAVRVRRAIAEDEVPLAALIGDFRDFLGQREPSDASIRRELRKLLPAQDADWFVAAVGRDLGGYALLRTRDSVWAEGP